MRDGSGSAVRRESSRRGRYLLAALAVALVAGLGASLPVLAQADGGGVEPQVIGGNPVPDKKYRFMTSLQADLDNDPPYEEHFCGGTLIDRNSVLTAAHCVEFIGEETTQRTLGFRDVRLDVGVTVLNSDAGQRRGIEKLSDIHMHPDYTGRTGRFDVAVINLGRPIKNIRPIKLADPASGDDLETAGEDAIVTGWGDTRPQPAFGSVRPGFPKRMQVGDPPLVADADCEAAYDDPGLPAFRVDEQIMVCAGQTREDTCAGDSGGPMFVGTSFANRRQIGITSFGLGCGATGFPGVYTEVNAGSIHGFIQRSADRR